MCQVCRAKAKPRLQPRLLGSGHTNIVNGNLIWVAIYANMGHNSLNMKTTIDIADDLFERLQQLARKEGTTFRSLTEHGLRLVLAEKQGRPPKLPPLVTVRGNGLTDEFKTASWEQLRDASYRGRGA